MRGPIDFIVVGFKGAKFDGSILKALADAINKGVIELIALSVVSKNKKGEVTMLDITNADDKYLIELNNSSGGNNELISKEDIAEVSELMEEDTAAGLLIIEHLWARPLKEAIQNAKGYLVADGRIHPEAAATLTS